ncbi:hypothetical protein PRIC2_003784 [Phytophthora ramorum]
MDGFADLVDDLLALPRGNNESVEGAAVLEASAMDLAIAGSLHTTSLSRTNNYRPIVFLLLSHGADASSRDRFACSPMHYVKSLSVAKLLLQYGGKVLDYNAKKKHAVETIKSFADTIRKDHSLGTAERGRRDGSLQRAHKIYGETS